MSSRAGFVSDFDKYRAVYERLEGCKELVLTYRLLGIGGIVRTGKISWTKSDLKDIVRWKHLDGLTEKIETNPPDQIQERLKDSLRFETDESRIAVLCRISGVGPAVASAILWFTWPDFYGVLDYHAWNALIMLGYNLTEKEGDDFTEDELIRYLEMVRNLAREKDSIPREVNKALYTYHRVKKEKEWNSEFESVSREWQSGQ